MDAYYRCINLGKKMPIVLPSIVEAENFADHPRKFQVICWAAE
jgi:hypothetical protein